MNSLNVDAATRLFCIFGNPVGHSLSPTMHNRAFAELGINAVYTAFCVQDIGAAVKAIRALDIGGASVTIPHKVSVMEHLDEIDGAAQSMGAVNTIINKDGKLIGRNSDCLGAVGAIKEKIDLKEKSLILLGAGGAARAMAYGAKQEGAAVVIANRTAEKGESLAKDLGVDFIPLDEIQSRPCDILVNSTPVGMVPNTDASPVEANFFKPAMAVMDMVYRPLETRLLKEAKAKGCITVDGVSMFVHQGVAQFEWWTQKPAPVEIMRQTVTEILNRD